MQLSLSAVLANHDQTLLIPNPAQHVAAETVAADIHRDTPTIDAVRPNHGAATPTAHTRVDLTDIHHGATPHTNTCGKNPNKNAPTTNPDTTQQTVFMTAARRRFAVENNAPHAGRVCAR